MDRYSRMSDFFDSPAVIPETPQQSTQTESRQQASGGDQNDPHTSRRSTRNASAMIQINDDDDKASTYSTGRSASPQSVHRNLESQTIEPDLQQGVRTPQGRAQSQRAIPFSMSPTPWRVGPQAMDEYEPDPPGRRRSRKEPDKFDGESIQWEDYTKHFDLVTKWNRWDNYEKALQLGASLTGHAQRVLGDLSAESCENYDELVQALESRFAPKDRKTAFKNEFRKRKRHRGENLRDYAYTLRRLASQAFNITSYDALQELVIEQFTLGLDNVDLQKHVHFTRPTTLEAAISAAVEWEAVDFKDPSTQAPSKPRSAKVKAGVMYDANPDGGHQSTTVSEVAQLPPVSRQAMTPPYQMTTSPQGQRSTSERQHRLDTGACLICGEIGHFRRNCPHRQRQRRGFGSSADMYQQRNPISSLPPATPTYPGYTPQPVYRPHMTPLVTPQSYLPPPPAQYNTYSQTSTRYPFTQRTSARIGSGIRTSAPTTLTPSAPMHPTPVVSTTPRHGWSSGLKDSSGWHIPGRINGVNVNFLVDTGSTHSIISKDMYERLPTASRPALYPVDKNFSTVTGQPMATEGYGVFRLEVAGEVMDFPLVVVPAEDPGLMGVDLISQLDATLHLGRGELVVKGVPHKMHFQTGTSVARVHVKETMEIPPQYEATLPCKLGRLQTDVPEDGVLEPNPAYVRETGLLVSSTVIDRSNELVPITVINPNVEPVRVVKGAPIAQLQEVEQVIPLQSESSPETESNWELADDVELPGHLQPLIDQASDALTREQLKRLKRAIYQYQDVFLGVDGKLGLTHMAEHHIDTGDHPPIKQPPRRIPQAQRAVVEEEVKKMLEQGIVEPSCSPWASPIVLVTKKDGSVRFCVDYRRLNSVTKKDAYPLPRIHESLDTLSGSRFFSTMDMASGYWQLKMADDGSKEKTAFCTHLGLHQFTVLAFGLCNAPATYERLMENVLRGLQWKECLVFIDDVICVGRDFDTALANLIAVWQRFREANLKLKPKKCHLFQENVTFLGHLVSPEGVRCDPEKVKAVAHWPVPTNLTEVRSFVGFCAYYRRHIHRFSEIAAPMIALTRGNPKKRQIQWTEQCQHSFETLKKALTDAPLLVYPTEDGQFILDTDASGDGMGAVLSQLQDGQERVIAYGSRTLNRAQRNYCTTKRELLAVFTFIKHFRHYLWGRNFILRTDHASLRWLKNFQDVEGMLARWLTVLDMYSFEIVHRAGAKHVNADSLSRIPCRQCKREDCPTSDTSKVAAVHTRSRKVNQSEEDSSIQASEQSFEEWCQNYAVEELKELQQEDPAIAKMMVLLARHRQKPPWAIISTESKDLKAMWSQWNSLVVVDDLLYRDWAPSERMPKIRQLVTPWPLRKKIMKFVHNKKLAGHLGVTKTLHNVRQRFYWPGHKQDVIRWCQRCNVCATRKPRTGPKKAPLHQSPVGDRMERVAMDILGPLPTTENGNQYVCVLSDYFTKWAEAYALPDHTAQTIAERLMHEFILKYGIPRVLHSDQGQDFQSKLMTQLCRLLEIDKTKTCTYRPQSDAIVERANRTLLQMLSCFVNDYQDNWDDLLPYMMSAYTATAHDSTRCSPDLMFLGREKTMPIDLLMGGPPKDQVPQCPHEYVVWVKEATLIAHEYARKYLQKAAERQKRNYDVNTKYRKYPIGTWVWYFYPPKGHQKLGRGWTGPYLVIDEVTDVNFRIQEAPGTKSKIVHMDQLKAYVGDPPRESWVEPPPDPAKRVENVADDNFSDDIEEPDVQVDQLEEPVQSDPELEESEPRTEDISEDREVQVTPRSKERDRDSTLTEDSLEDRATEDEPPVEVKLGRGFRIKKPVVRLDL